MKETDKTIRELVKDDLKVARALHFLGIHFHNYSEQTLSQACEKEGLALEVVVRKLNEVSAQKNTEKLDFVKYPINLIVEYLRHNHYIFIKERLAYISQMLKDYQDSTPIVKDLQFIFPEFVKEFVEHIYEEEDTIFAYILELYKYRNTAIDENASIFPLLKQNYMKGLADAHRHNDDEMKSLRDFTKNYACEKEEDLHGKVILDALKSLENELRIHANIENNILFKKAVDLEKELTQKIAVL